MSPYREMPKIKSNLDLLYEKYEQEKVAYDRATARSRLKFLVDRWREAKQLRREPAIFENQIEDQIKTIQEFDPQFSFEIWLSHNYSKVV